ncbi:DUF308 domain-containing protein [Candidatus Saccharibacteria bacterium]|jgi:uncharacterized membrane protein HdeD (DUF308 family)|nr:DUF308 domain-containing protein [Candidatus Saccharibacteria bacterium]
MTKAEIINRPVEQVGNDIKKSAWLAVIESLTIIIMGVLFIAWPDYMVRIISYIFGIFFIIKGAFQIINYFVEKGQNDFFNNELLVGVISVLLGVAAIAVGAEIANVFRVVLGIWLVYESLVRINTAIKLSAAGIPVWKYILLIGLGILLLGVFVVFNDVTVVIGWMMIIAGIIGIFGDVLFMQQIDNLISKITK